jgi:hypothetical protein
MAGATTSKAIAPSGKYTPEDLEELALPLGLPVEQCHYEINALNGGVRTLSARRRTAADPVQDLGKLPVPSAEYVRTKLPGAA